MIIHCLSSTYSSHGVLTSRLQICASILIADVSQPTSTTIRSSTGLKDYPTMIDGAAFPAPSNTSAPCKVHSIPIHPPH
jgi:hypothetical protein